MSDQSLTEADPLRDFQDKFTYAYPNHFPQHKLNKLLLKKLQELGENKVLFNTAYKGHTFIAE